MRKVSKNIWNYKEERDLENGTCWGLSMHQFLPKKFLHVTVLKTIMFCNVNSVSLRSWFSMVLEYPRLISVETNYQQSNYSKHNNKYVKMKWNESVQSKIMNVCDGIHTSTDNTSTDTLYYHKNAH